MSVVKATCERRGGRRVVYTGVDDDGELRDCAACGCEVAVDPRCDEVLHVETE
ncbi:hypothetical protein C440_04863 [Haloferax mucosum ATCC BAA-1512]|uniref:Uncharacterized protein n=1 Tax=Haloferax mucosum ATCC BAA-1512 TaxID=662479 RepID=M0II56_9EURY|nr:hypothetical protein C440_04863 [Haloferax mucosum ATCC BAA-1512]